jgi:two-component system, OmpR family, response regulator
MAHLLAGIKIVVVEDDDDNREVLADHLTAESATVMAVSTAAEALPLVPSADIIVTDYALPGEDAVWLLERVNKQPSPIPVIVVSGYDERQKPRAWRQRPSPASCSSPSTSVRCVPRSPWFWAIDGDRPPGRQRSPPAHRARCRARDQHGGAASRRARLPPILQNLHSRSRRLSTPEAVFHADLCSETGKARCLYRRREQKPPFDELCSRRFGPTVCHLKVP